MVIRFFFKFCCFPKFSQFSTKIGFSFNKFGSLFSKNIKKPLHSLCVVAASCDVYVPSINVSGLTIKYLVNTEKQKDPSPAGRIIDLPAPDHFVAFCLSTLTWASWLTAHSNQVNLRYIVIRFSIQANASIYAVVWTPNTSLMIQVGSHQKRMNM